jgi:hypothetical protein
MDFPWLLNRRMSTVVNECPRIVQILSQGMAVVVWKILILAYVFNQSVLATMQCNIHKKLCWI